MTGLGKKYLRVLSFVLAVVMAVACVNGKGTEVWAKPAKTVVPFCTSMSSGLGSSAKNLKKNAVISKKTNWMKGRNFYGGSSQKKVDKWVKSLAY